MLLDSYSSLVFCVHLQESEGKGEWQRVSRAASSIGFKARRFREIKCREHAQLPALWHPFIYLRHKHSIIVESVAEVRRGMVVIWLKAREHYGGYKVCPTVGVFHISVENKMSTSCSGSATGRVLPEAVMSAESATGQRTIMPKRRLGQIDGFSCSHLWCQIATLIRQGEMVCCQKFSLHWFHSLNPCCQTTTAAGRERCPGGHLWGLLCISRSQESESNMRGALHSCNWSELFRTVEGQKLPSLMFNYHWSYLSCSEFSLQCTPLDVSV